MISFTIAAVQPYGGPHLQGRAGGRRGRQQDGGGHLLPPHHRGRRRGGPPPAVDGVRIVAGVERVHGAGDGVGQLLRHRVDPHLVGRRFPGFTGRAGSYELDLVLPSPSAQRRLLTLFRLFLAVPALLVANALGTVLWVVAFLGWGILGWLGGAQDLSVAVWLLIVLMVLWNQQLPTSRLIAEDLLTPTTGRLPS